MDFTDDDYIQIREEDVTATKQIVCIENLPDILDENDYKRYFKQYGKMKGLRLEKTVFGASRGKVLVKFEDPDIARICAETLNNHILEGKLLKTSLIDSKDNKPLKTSHVDINSLKRSRVNTSDEFKPRVSEYQNDENKLRYQNSIKALKEFKLSYTF